MSKTGKKWAMLGGGVLGVILGYFGWKNRLLLTTNDVTSGESAAYPKLRSRVYYAGNRDVLAAAEQAVRALARWRVVYADPENDVLEAEVETPIGKFLDDVTVYVTPLERGQTRVTIRSRSRVGKGDLGQNAHHIRELQAAMDTRLTGDAAF